MGYPSFRSITIFWIIKVFTKLDTGTFKLKKDLYLVIAGCSSPETLNRSAYNWKMRGFLETKPRHPKLAKGARSDQESAIAEEWRSSTPSRFRELFSAKRVSSPHNTGGGSRSVGIMPSVPRFRCSCDQPQAATTHALTVSWQQVTGP
jgi:hypothetical protein